MNALSLIDWVALDCGFKYQGSVKQARLDQHSIRIGQALPGNKRPICRNMSQALPGNNADNAQK